MGVRSRLLTVVICSPGFFLIPFQNLVSFYVSVSPKVVLSGQSSTPVSTRK